MKPINKSKNAPIASNEVESSLKDVETTLLQQVNSFFGKKELLDTNPKTKKLKTKSSEIENLALKLRKSTKVVVPTD